MSPAPFPTSAASSVLPEPFTDDDGVYYPVSDNMGESFLQTEVIATLLPLLRDYMEQTSRRAFVSTNQFIYYRRGDPKSVVSPDIYVIDDEPARPRDKLKSWKVWQHGGKAPTLAIEVVSDEYRKDYADTFLTRYRQLKVRELIRYDPEHGGRHGRQLLSHFVRNARGVLTPRPCLSDRIHCRCYDVWFVLQPDETLRLATGPHGDTLWLIATELARRKAEAAVDAVRRQAEATEAALRAEIAELRRSRP